MSLPDTDLDGVLAGALFADARDGLCLFDAAGNLLVWNESFASFFPELAPHLRRALPIGDLAAGLGSVACADAAPAVSMAELLASQRKKAWPVDFHHKQSGRWFRLTSRDLPDHRRLIRWRDITAAHHDENVGARLHHLLDDLHVGLVLGDAAGRIHFANPGFFATLGAEADFAAITDAAPFWEALRPALAEPAALPPYAAAGAAQSGDGWLHLATRDGRWFTLRQQISPEGVAIVLVDASELKRREDAALAAKARAERILQQTRDMQAELVRTNERLTQLAETDSLTGVNNRGKFLDILRTEFSRSRRYGRELAVIMIDIDRFKRINDSFGHAVGDAALMRTAERLAGSIRAIDVLGRLGGEEFAILLPETTVESARNLAERLRRSIGQIRLASANNEISFTASFGVAAKQDDDADPTAILGRADKALYAAKRHGRNRVELG